VEQLKSARVNLGISQYELAKRSGISRTMIHHLENGKRNPTLITVHALANALNLDLSKLVHNVCEIIQRPSSPDDPSWS
jgi:transcriptional regulator with XRE-family HTH domain